MFDQFMKGFSTFKAPQFDATKMFAIQQKNTEVLSTTIQEWSEATQEIMKKSVEFAKQNAEESMNFSRDFDMKAPEKNLAAQGEYMKKTLDSCTKQASELNKLATESQSKVMETLSARFKETLEEAA